MYLEIFVDEFGDIQNLKSSQVYGVGYFAIRSNVLPAFKKNLINIHAGTIHMRELLPNQKLEIIKKFSVLASKFPCFGGAYIQTKPNSGVEVVEQGLRSSLSDKGFETVRDPAHPHNLILKKVMNDTRYYEAYLAALRLPFVHEGLSVMKGKSKGARVHIGITGGIQTFHKKVSEISPSIFNAANESKVRFDQLGISHPYKNIQVLFNLTNENPMLGPADIFATVGRYKHENISRHHDCLNILKPVLQKIKMDTFLLV